MNARASGKRQGQYVYGPVPSRRLGRSLGVDLVPFKTCTYDCVYCQLGKTTHKTIQRKEWVPLDKLIEELKGKLCCRPDYITLAGSGEPTLYLRLEELIAGIKNVTDIPVVVLTNGSLLWLPAVRNSLRQADIVIPSCDCGTDELFQRVNRPHFDLSFDTVLEGLTTFRQMYRGEYFLEVFLIDGINTAEAAINTLAHCIERIRPDKVQLNTVTRPPAERSVRRISRKQLQVIAQQLYDNTEVIADYHDTHEQHDFSACREAVLGLLQRRPCTVDDVADGLGLHRNEALKHIEELVGQESVQTQRQNGQTYYRTAETTPHGEDRQS